MAAIEATSTSWYPRSRRTWCITSQTRTNPTRAGGPYGGTAELANFWAEFQKRGRVTRWTLDHGIVEGDEAVIERSMMSVGPGDHPRRMLQGTER
jgi:hypothetical protein